MRVPTVRLVVVAVVADMPVAVRVVPVAVVKVNVWSDEPPETLKLVMVVVASVTEDDETAK